jgi:uncharacterized protein (TIGR02246 family)
MSEKASSLVSQAKRWATHYGSYANGEEGAVLTVPLRIKAAWQNNDADAFAEMFDENGSYLMGDEQLNTRETIREHMAAAFSGDYRGTSLDVEPVNIRSLSDGVALAITKGGIVPDGGTAVSPEAQERATWIVTKRSGDWKLFSLQSSPITG